MRRGGVDGEGRRQVRAAFRILYRSGLAPAAAAARLTAELGGHPLVARLVDFIGHSKRGIILAPPPANAPMEDAESEQRVW